MQFVLLIHTSFDGPNYPEATILKQVRSRQEGKQYIARHKALLIDRLSEDYDSDQIEDEDWLVTCDDGVETFTYAIEGLSRSAEDIDTLL